MNLESLLAELRENILHDRSDRISGATDRLWSDATLIRYIDEAQKRFARLGLVLRDGTTDAATLVTLVEGQTEYTLHASVLAVISAKFPADPGDLARAGHSAFGVFQTPDRMYFDPAQISQLPAGKPLAYSTDESVSEDEDGHRSAVTLRVYPAPSAAYDAAEIRLRVARLPLDDLTPSTLKASPEIPSVHHIEMLDWAAYLALRINDHDAGNPGRAHEFRSLFGEHVRQARNEAMRKMFVPQQWGFGRNGFSWET